MNKILSIKSNAIFLAAVLVVGTFAAIAPSSFIIGVQAQHYPQYGMDTGYNSYEPDYGMDKNYNSYASQYPQESKDKNNYGPDYPPKYTDDRKYNSYKPQYYEMDNGYDKKTYGYESKYSSYGKDDISDKSKKESSNSVSIKKLNCINTNVNFNGDNNGNITTFAASPSKAGASEEGNWNADLLGGNYGEKYDGYNKKDKDFACIINNNNNNTINIGTGNATDDDVINTCEECLDRFLQQRS